MNLQQSLPSPVTGELIQEVTDRIVAELQPEVIILFGSYAWGVPNRYSDLDLFVVVPDGIPGFNRVEWAMRADRCLDDLLVDADILVQTRSTLKEYRHVKGALTRKIIEEGRVLYDQGQTEVGPTLDC